MLAHNVETVPRIFKRIRPAFRYDRSLDVLTQARDFGLVTKSNLILGMGETREEVSQALRDLHEAGCELVTITQYLRPSARHHPVERWVKPEEFVELAAEAEEIGFSGVHVAGRSCVRRTAPVGCTVRPWTPASARRPDHPTTPTSRRRQQHPHGQGPTPETAEAPAEPRSSSSRPTRWPRRPTRPSACGSLGAFAARRRRRLRRCSGCCPASGVLGLVIADRRRR